MKFIPKAVNVALHPVVITIFGVFLIVYKNTNNFVASIYWTFNSLIFMAMVALFVVYGVRKGFFNNLDVSNRKQRIILYPFIIAVVILFSAFVIVFNGPDVLVDAGVLIIIALVLLDIINTRIKVSGHVGVVSAFVTGLVYAYGGLALFSFFLVPLIAWARIVERRHTFKETLVGAICGITFSYVAISIVQLVI